MRRLAPLAAAAFCVTFSGCCSMARFFCGPDKSPWVSVDFTTPERTVRTLLEALRRDDPDVVYLCLSEDYKRRIGVDHMAATAVWPKIREQNPGLHVAGYAEVPPATFRGSEHARVLLDVEGRRLAVELVRQSLWQVRYRRNDGSTGEFGQNLDSFVGLARLEPIDDDDYSASHLDVQPLRFRHPGADEVPLEAIEHVALTRAWKVADLALLAP